MGRGAVDGHPMSVKGHFSSLEELRIGKDHLKRVAGAGPIGWHEILVGVDA